MDEKNTKSPKRKLKLSPETIRTLQETELEVVAGGTGTHTLESFVCCSTGVNTCTSSCY